MKGKFLVVLLGLVLSLCILSTLAQGEAEQTSSLSSQLEGTWKFVSSIGRNNKGEVYHPYGENLFGMLMYDVKGYISVLLMNPERPKFASGDMMKGTSDEIKAAFVGFDAYCGTYIIDTEKSKVTHKLQGSKFPNWVGTEQVRFFKISGDTLRITAPPILAGGVQWNFEAVLVRL